MLKALQPSIEDFLVVCGLITLGYGLHLYQPWLAFVVVGTAVTVIGLSIGQARAKKGNGQHKVA